MNDETERRPGRGDGDGKGRTGPRDAGGRAGARQGGRDRPAAGSNADAPPRRAAAAAGQARAAATRARLIEAGLRCFGRDGFDATTTRALAAEASVNLAAIPYHFDGKEGLYLATAEHIAGRIRSRLAPLLAQADAVAARGAAGREDAAALIVDILTGLGRLLLSEEAALWAPIVLREQMAPSAAFDRLYDGAMRHVAGTLARLLGQCMDRPPEREDIRIRAVALVGQMVVFRAAHAAVLRQLEIDRLDAAHAARIVAVVREHARAVLDAALAGALGGEAGDE